jgi:hypothetical protein
MKVVPALLVLSLFASDEVTAANRIVCVASTPDLSDALATLANSASNTDSDELRIRTGTYLAPAGGWVGAVTTHHDLVIRGGYTDEGCTQQTNDASATILDGHDSVGVMAIDTPLIPNSNIEISGLTFQNGNATAPFGNVAGGLRVGDSGPISGGNILIERNIFRSNVGDSPIGSSMAGGLVAATDGQSLIVRNNLFVNNSAKNSAALVVYSNNAIDVSNNTFTGNQSTDTTLQQRVIIDFSTFGGLLLSNNIFWGNAITPGVFDIDLGGQFVGATLANNDIESSTGTPVADVGTVSVDPEFVGSTDFRLARTSPLIDAGINDAPGGLATIDLDGSPRVEQGSVDLGAFESSYIFANGFED